MKANISKRVTGGYTLILSDDNYYEEFMFPYALYSANNNGIILYLQSGGKIFEKQILAEDWTINSVNGFTTVQAAINALDELGVSANTSSINIVDEAGNILNPNGQPHVETVEITRPADTTAYTAKDAINSSTSEPVAFEFEQIAIANGGGGVLMDVKIDTNMTNMASTDVRIWVFNEAPTSIAGDNSAFVTAYANKDKLLFFVDVTMEALEGASDNVVGQATIIKEYKCADTSLFALVETITGFTPTSGGKLNVTFSCLKLS